MRMIPILLHGPYRPPRLRTGDRATCLLRDGDVVITGWSEAPIPWPRCRAFGTHGGGSGLLLEEELAHAVRCESSQAIQHWWGVTEGVVWRWRMVLGVGRWESEGSRQLLQEMSVKGAAAMKARGLTDAERKACRRRARQLNLGQYLKTGYHGPWWTQDELALLATHSDAEVAQRTRRSVNAVRLKRQKLRRM